MQNSTPGLALQLQDIQAGGFKVPVNTGAKALSYTGHVVVKDTGSLPIFVKPEAITLGKHTQCTQGPPSWLRLDVATVKILPGHSSTLAFHVVAQPGQTGDGALLAVGSTGVGHGIHASAGVGARVLIGNGANTCTKPSAVFITHPSSGPPVLLIVLIAVAVALVIAGVVVARRRMRRSA